MLNFRFCIYNPISAVKFAMDVGIVPEVNVFAGMLLEMKNDRD
jgi:hypothetical protein